jgi:hypothetical protein
MRWTYIEVEGAQLRAGTDDYVSSVLAKLGLERRTQAAVLATKLLGEH